MLRILLAFLLSCVVLALYFIQKKRRRYLELAALVPTFKGRLPIAGHVYMLIGGSERFWLTVQEVSLATEKAGGVLAVWVGSSVIFLPTWKRNRKMLNPTFSQHILDGFMAIFNRQEALLAQDLEPLAGAGEFDPTEYLTERTLETVCQTAVGISLDDRSVIDNKYKKAVETVFDVLAQRLASFWLHPDFIYRFSALKQKEDEAIAVLHNMSRSVLHKRRTERQQARLANTSSRRFIAFLDLLLDLAEDGSFTDDQIQQELDTLIAAGHDTSARALTSTPVLVGTHQDVQEKVYQE